MDYYFLRKMEKNLLPYLVTDICINCKYTDCVKVCPVDCFHEGENMLVINPEECIDCGLCEPECPIDAIIPDTNEDANKWLDLNRELSATWPQIMETKKPLPEAEKWKLVSDKIKYLKIK